MKTISLWLLLLALAARLCAMVLWPFEMHTDSSDYLALAQNLRFHGVLSFGAPHPWGTDAALNSPGPYTPTAARAPLYPLMIALLWWRSGPPIIATQVVQAVLGSLTVLLVFGMADRAFGRRSAFLSGIAVALAPLTVRSTADVMSETLFTFLLTLGIWLWGRKRDWLAGMVLGLGALTRTILLPLFPALALGIILLPLNRARHARILAGAVLVITPWMTRNVVTQGRFIPVAAQGFGSNLIFGTIYVPYGTGATFNERWPAYGSDPEVQQISLSSASETEAEGRMMRAAVQRIVRAPIRWFLVCAVQYPRLFTDSGGYFYQLLPIPSRVIKYTLLFCNMTFLGLALAGAWLATTRWRDVYHLALYPLVLVVAQFATVTDGRYSLPIVPFMAIFAAFALTHAQLFSRLGAPLRWARPSPPQV